MLQPRQRRARQPDDPAVTGSRSRVTSHVISLRRLLASGFSAGVVLGVVALAGCSGSPSGPATAFGAAAKLTFVVQPSDAIVGAADTPAVQVAIQDARGNTVTTATTSITLGIGTNPGTGTLSGTTTVAAINGVATFANMRVNTLGAGYTLTASAATLTGATSHSFNIVTASACPAPAPQPTPASASSWQWTNLGEPFDESDLQSVRVDPEDNDVLYVGGGKGLFVSRDAGHRMDTRSNSRLSISEIAERLNVGRLAVYSMLEQGIIPAVRLRRRWIVTKHAYMLWERTCGVKAATGLRPKPDVLVVN